MTERTADMEDPRPGDERAGLWTQEQLQAMDAAFAARMAASLAQPPAAPLKK